MLQKGVCPSCGSEDVAPYEDEYGWSESCNKCDALYGVSNTGTGPMAFTHMGSEIRELERLLDKAEKVTKCDSAVFRGWGREWGVEDEVFGESTPIRRSLQEACSMLEDAADQIELRDRELAQALFRIGQLELRLADRIVSMEESKDG